MKDDWKVIWCGLEGCEAARLANTQANRSKQAAQLSPGGCSARFVPAGVWALVISDDGGRRSHFLCLLVFRPWDGVGEDGMGCALVGST